MDAQRETYWRHRVQSAVRDGVPLSVTRAEIAELRRERLLTMLATATPAWAPFGQSPHWAVTVTDA